MNIATRSIPQTTTEEAGFEALGANPTNTKAVNRIIE